MVHSLPELETDETRFSLSAEICRGLRNVVASMPEQINTPTMHFSEVSRDSPETLLKYIDQKYMDWVTYLPWSQTKQFFLIVKRAFFPRALLTISHNDKHKAKSVQLGTHLDIVMVPTCTGIGSTNLKFWVLCRQIFIFLVCCNKFLCRKVRAFPYS